MKVLHITNWYPSTPTPNSAPFIKKQIDALGLLADNKVWHIEITKGSLALIKGINNDNSRYLILSLPFTIWRITEWISFWMVLRILLREKGKYDLVNFHIAYPNLTYWHLIKRFINIPIVITEHWSAYHFNFGVKKNLPRIQKIFNQGIPTITISNALKQDIEEFAKTDINGNVVPNVVDNEIFYPALEQEREAFFFMVSQWKWPKKPLVVVESFKAFLKHRNDFKLIIGGYGPLLPEIEEWILSNNLQDSIELLGVLNGNEIADYMRKCTAYLHPSEYETFSVVCAEAISCSTPVIASNVGGIPEVIENNGILLDGLKINEWVEAMEKVVKEPIKVSTAHNRFSLNQVGKEYYNVLNRIISEANQ